MKRSWLKGAALALSAAALFALAGCGGGEKAEAPAVKQQTNTTGYPVEISNYNSQGQPVTTVYDHPPKRIIALWQNSIETLLQLGAKDSIIAAIGIDDVRHLTEEDQKLFETLPYTSPRTTGQEQAVEMNPDFILGWLFDFTGKANSVGTWSFWHQRNVPVYMTLTNNADFAETHTVEDELRYIKDVGAIVGKTERADEIIASIEARLKEGEAKGKQLPYRPKVLIVSSLQKGLYIYTPRTLAGNIATRLGGDVIGKEVENTGNSEILSYESLLYENPDILFVQSAPERDELVLKSVYDNEKLSATNAVKNRRVYTVPFYTIRCPAVRVTDAIDIFEKGLQGQGGESFVMPKQEHGK